jgi:hypothetical protein
MPRPTRFLPRLALLGALKLDKFMISSLNAEAGVPLRLALIVLTGRYIPGRCTANRFLANGILAIRL